MQQVAWKNREKLNEVSTASDGETDISAMPEGLSKIEQLKVRVNNLNWSDPLRPPV